MKRGITVSLIATFIAVMTILATTITISATKTIANAKLRSFATELTLVQDKIKQKLKQGTDSSYISNIVSLDLTNVTINIKNEQFNDEKSITNDEKIIINNILQLYEIDLDSLGIYNTTYGRKKSPTDIYAVSMDTGKVYYVAGIKANGTTYYTLTEDLNIKIGNKFETTNQTEQIRFLPSNIYWTNEAITTNIIYSTETFSDVSVAAISNSGSSINSGSPFPYKENFNAIKVNKDYVKTNYTITVSYTKNGSIKTETFNIENYDGTPPTIFVGEQIYTKATDYFKSYILNVSATDNQSGVKVIKYESEDLIRESVEESLSVEQLERIKEYFASYGTELKDNKILIENAATEYTIYAEDNAGNISVEKVKISDEIINLR